MATKKIFKSKAKNVCLTFSSGKKVQFVQGCYFTSDDNEVAELTKECNSNSGMFYIDPKDSELDTEAEAKRIAALKAEAVAEYIASQEKLADTSTDMGTTAIQELKPVGTDKLLGMLAQSTSSGAAAVASK